MDRGSQQFLWLPFEKKAPKKFGIEKQQSTLQRRVHGWWCFKAGKVEVKKKSKLPKARLRNWRLRDRTFWWKMPCNHWKLLMSLKWMWNSKWDIPQIWREWLIFVGIPNSASSSQTNRRFGEPHHRPLARDHWNVGNSQNLVSRCWHQTTWQCVVLNSWARSSREKPKTPEIHRSFVPCLLGRLILDSPVKTRPGVSVAWRGT